jgi:hypothetical protein
MPQRLQVSTGNTVSFLGCLGSPQHMYEFFNQSINQSFMHALLQHWLMNKFTDSVLLDFSLGLCQVSNYFTTLNQQQYIIIYETSKEQSIR